MAKLNKAHQKQVNDAEGGGFKPHDPGLYVVKFGECDTDNEGPKGPYWKMVCDIQSTIEGEPASGKTFDNLSLSADAAWKFKQFFDAFGVPTDTDTDDLVGRLVVQRIGTRTIQKGERAGEPADSVEEWLPYEETGSEDDGGF